MSWRRAPIRTRIITTPVRTKLKFAILLRILPVIKVLSDLISGDSTRDVRADEAECGS